jgi:hypothetical protein
MGYDIAIVSGPVPRRDKDAWSELEALIDESGPAPETFRILHERLTQRYPCITMLGDGNEDIGVWKDGPLWNSFGHRAAHLGLVSNRADEVLPFLVETSISLNLTVFDWVTQQIHRADGLPGISLDIEEKPSLLAPTLQQLEDSVDALTSRGGPGFLVLSSAGADYAQVAGGDGAYCVEWREHAGQSYAHFRAGLPGHPNAKEIAVPTNGFQVTVQENERLDITNAKAILAAFATHSRRPTQFVWREIKF